MKMDDVLIKISKIKRSIFSDPPNGKHIGLQYQSRLMDTYEAESLLNVNVLTPVNITQARLVSC